MATPSDSNVSPPAYTSDNDYEWVDRVGIPAQNVLPARSIPSIPSSHTPQEHGIPPYCHGPRLPPQPSSLPCNTDLDTDADSISSLALDPRSNSKINLEGALACSSRFYTPSTVLDARTPTYTLYKTPFIASITTSLSSSHPVLQASAQGRPSSVHTQSNLLRVALNNATIARRDIDEAAQAQAQVQTQPYAQPTNSQTEQKTPTDIDQGHESHEHVRAALDNAKQAQQRVKEAHGQLHPQPQRQVVPQLRNQTHSQPQPQHPHQIRIGSQAVHIYTNPHPSAPSLTFPHSRPFSRSNFAPNSDPEPFDWRPARRPTDQYFIERRNREKVRRRKHRKFAAIAVGVFLALLVVLVVVLVLVFKYRKEKEEDGKSGGRRWSNRVTYWQEGRQRR